MAGLYYTLFLSFFFFQDKTGKLKEHSLNVFYMPGPLCVSYYLILRAPGVVDGILSFLQWRRWWGWKVGISEINRRYT